MCRVKESVATRVARGAQALDAVYGPKWFRTENVSLADVKKQGEDRYASFNMFFENFNDTYVSFTEKLRAEQSVAKSCILSSEWTGDEVDGEMFGFYGGDEQALAAEWVNQIRARRYNRPSRSTERHLSGGVHVSA